MKHENKSDHHVETDMVFNIRHLVKEFVIDTFSMRLYTIYRYMQCISNSAAVQT